jgi:ABC-type antimicrobial peptide transport system permease subunit
VFTSFEWNYPRTGPTPLQIELIITGIALAFAMFVVGVSLALAAAESKDERDVLTVAGAAPRVLARSAGSKAFLLAGIGGLMAVPIGFLPVLVFAQAETDGFPVIFPTAIVALLVLGVPTVVGLASMLASATAQRMRPVRVSTAVFD